MTRRIWQAIAGMEKMAQEGIHYVVGPNVDDGAAAVRPVAEAKGIMYFPYAFPKELYAASCFTVLGMIIQLSSPWRSTDSSRKAAA
ncbi:MAG: hypothetical protein R3E83_13475 [Burkholderiaceae bacterium]